MTQRTPRFVDLMHTRAFAVLFTAEAQSDIGDQLARVALSVLVYERTGSAAATALTYAVTFLPSILGGLVLGRLGDRFPRRTVMVLTDLARAVLFAGLVLPGIPLPAMYALLVVAVFLGPAFSSSQLSYLADALDSESYRSASSIRSLTYQITQVGGFALGGLFVAVLHPRGALLLDAVTFLASALLVGCGLTEVKRYRRGVEQVGVHIDPANVDGAPASARPKWATAHVRGLIALSSLAGFSAVPEGLSVPFAHNSGGATVVAGLLLASLPLGGAVGALLVRRVPVGRRARVARMMAVATGVPLAVSGLAGSWPLAIGCWFVCGVLSAYQIEVVAAIVQAIPPTVRSHAMGVVGSTLLTAQGLGVCVFGFVAVWTTAAASVGWAGIVGAALAAVIVLCGAGAKYPAPQSQ